MKILHVISSLNPEGGGPAETLRQFVPHQPVTGNATDINEPEEWYAGQPGEKALAAQPIERELTQYVQEDDDDESVGRVAMQAAHHARCVPLIVSDVFDRRIGIGDAGIEEQVQVKAWACDDPEKIPTERPQIGEWVVALSEAPVKDCLGTRIQYSEDAFYKRHENTVILRVATRTR